MTGRQSAGDTRCFWLAGSRTEGKNGLNFYITKSPQCPHSRSLSSHGLAMPCHGPAKPSAETLPKPGCFRKNPDFAPIVRKMPQIAKITPLVPVFLFQYGIKCPIFALKFSIINIMLQNSFANFQKIEKCAPNFGALASGFPEWLKEGTGRAKPPSWLCRSQSQERLKTLLQFPFFECPQFAIQ